MDCFKLIDNIIEIFNQIDIDIDEHTLDVKEKSKGNYVTSIDYSIEKTLVRELSKVVPEAGFISEENIYKEKEINWVIDPIDGTGNMIYGYPFAVSIALEKGGAPILGVVFDCVNNEVYYAVDSEGAYVKANTGEEIELHTNEFSKGNGVSIFGMPYNREKTDDIFCVAKKMYSISSDLKRVGPASLDICSVARGKARMYFEIDLKPWDCMAGEIILKEAGGCIIKNNDLLVFCAGQSVKNEVVELLK